MHIWIFDTYYVYNMFWKMYWAYLGEAQRLFCFGFLARSHQAAPLISSKKVLEHQITVRVCKPSIGNGISFSLCLYVALMARCDRTNLAPNFVLSATFFDLEHLGEIFAQEVVFTGDEQDDKHVFSSRLVAMIHAIIHGLLSLVRSPR
jgi:hypothetical protein